MMDLDNLRVVLVAARNPLNIGAAARAMSNFGVQRLRVVNPYEAAFREARSAVGASGLLAKAEQYDKRGRGRRRLQAGGGNDGGGASTRVAASACFVWRTAARLIKRQLKAGPVALLFGSERWGSRIRR